MTDKIVVELESDRTDMAEVYNYLHELMGKLGVMGVMCKMGVMGVMCKMDVMGVMG